MTWEEVLCGTTVDLLDYLDTTLRRSICDSIINTMPHYAAIEIEEAWQAAMMYCYRYGVIASDFEESSHCHGATCNAVLKHLGWTRQRNARYRRGSFNCALISELENEQWTNVAATLSDDNYEFKSRELGASVGWLTEGIKALSPKHQHMLKLFYEDDCTEVEVANTLGYPTKGRSVSVTKSRAIRRLREFVPDEPQGEGFIRCDSGRVLICGPDAHDELRQEAAEPELESVPCRVVQGAIVRVEVA